MNKKFILIGLDDEKSGEIAEILKNKTAKKILDFLSDEKEASETDISRALNMPLNTIEYNLIKLVKVGLIKKSKNFFWSKRGKKIPMYSLAKKHIIISPKNSKPSFQALKAILPFLGIFAVGLFIALFLFYAKSPVAYDDSIKQFSSYSELKSFIKENIQPDLIEKFDAANEAGASAGAFSATNIQVEGVDEPDFVKNDGKYIYIASGSKISIIDAYPAENMAKIAEITLNDYVNELFINKNKLIAFGNNFINIYDISDKSSPVLEKEIKTDGYYVDSRMIGNYVYIISNKYADSSAPVLPLLDVDGKEFKIKAEDIYYFPYQDSNYIFSSILSLNIENYDFEVKTYLTGYSSVIFVSQDNIYLSYTKYISQEERIEKMVELVFTPLMPEFEDEFKNILGSGLDFWEKQSKIFNLVGSYSSSLTGEEKAEFDELLLKKLNEFEFEIAKESEKTIIHKINVNGLNIDYKSAGEVPGHVLNQFSMDEYNGYLRIATTTGRSRSLNHLYVLDENIKIAGSIEDLAEGESIYSARFLGERAYIVTFRKIDPLFVIDLSNPKNPKVLGYLKITGYSDYLHIYDKNHIIGIGKETKGGDESFSWYQGIKISLFDVSDVENLKEVSKIEIGDRGTDSPVLYDHHAFLFDKEKSLLVIPITLAEINKSETAPDYAYGEIIWQGAYVFNINLEGIEERGRISHNDKDEINWYGKYSISRSLFMDDYLYTISQAKIKANNLNTIEEISSISLPYEDIYYI